MAGTSLPAAHHVAERFLSRGDVLGGDFRVKANTRSTIFGVRSVGPIVTDPASSRLILGLHCGSTGKTSIKDERTKPILSAEGVDLSQCCLGIERLHRTRSIFRGHKRDGTAPNQVEETRKSPPGSRRRHQHHEHGHHDASL